MVAQNLTELKKVVTIGYIVSGLSLGLWSSHLFPRLNLLGVGAITASVALSPIRKRQTELAITDAKRQLDADYAERREQLKEWEKELQGRSVDLDTRQMDLDREMERVERESEEIRKDLERQREAWEQERTIAEATAENERRDRIRELETEYQQRFAMRQSEIEQEYVALDAERKILDAETTKLEGDKERLELQQQQERELLDKQLQETLHTGLAQLEQDKQEIEVQARQWVADALEPMHEEIASLQGENEALKEQLAVATYPKIPRGIDRVCIYLKEVIPALYKLGFKLDYDSHTTNPNRDRVWFRPQNTFDIRELDKQSGLIQGLIGSKHPLSWRWIEKGLIELEVSTAGVETAPKTSKRKVADRIVSGEQWLIDLVAKCFHFRITGENGSGKSEFFNNLYCIAKYLVFAGQLDLTLIDPKFPMSEWEIEGKYFVPQYRSWESAVDGIEAMAGLVNARLETAKKNFDPENWAASVSVGLTPSMWALDETDTTMSQYKKEIKDNLRVGLKVGRALKVMVAYMSQSPLPDDIGLRRPDLQASGNIMLSTTAGMGLETLIITPHKKLELREEIAHLNEEGCKYYALVSYPGVDPFIARLPKPKAYAHLRIEPQIGTSPECDIQSVGDSEGDFSCNTPEAIPGGKSAALGDRKIVSKPADFEGALGDSVTEKSVTFKPNEEASQEEIDRVIGLLNSGVKNQATIVKNVWGVSRSGRKGSKYQRKVEVVKAIKSKVDC